MITVTTMKALELLRARGISVEYATLAQWVRRGKFEGAERRNEARGPVWHIPLKAVVKFIPPERGRPRNGSHKARG